LKGGEIGSLEVKNKKIGFVLTGSFYMLENAILKIKELLTKGADIIPIMSYNAYNIDTKYGTAKQFIEEIENITNKKIIHTIEDAEEIASKKSTDIMIIAPCSRKYDIKIST